MEGALVRTSMAETTNNFIRLEKIQPIFFYILIIRDFKPLKINKINKFEKLIIGAFLLTIALTVSPCKQKRRAFPILAAFQFRPASRSIFSPPPRKARTHVYFRQLFFPINPRKKSL